jgi:hypothetical protein
MFVMLVSETHFQDLWNKMQPTERHSVPGLPTRSLLLLPMNLLVFVKEYTIMANGPPQGENIMISEMHKYLQAAKVTHRLTK